VAREVEAVSASDARLMASADAIRKIASTLDQVSDDVLARLSSVNMVSEGGLSQLIAARLSEVGLRARRTTRMRWRTHRAVDAILRGARHHLH
jgi:hypothetical protein